MIYLPLSTLPPRQVSRALWALSRPTLQSEPTKEYCGWVEHSQSGQMALALRVGDTQPVHPQADIPIANLVAAVTPFCPPSEVEAFEADLIAHKGKRINIVEALPPTFADTLLTHEQMVSAGWFPDEVEEA